MSRRYAGSIDESEKVTPLATEDGTPSEEYDGVVDVCKLSYNGSSEFVRTASFPIDATVGQVSCMECGGSGYWGYGPVPETCGPCIECKGTGRVWVGLL